MSDQVLSPTLPSPGGLVEQSGDASVLSLPSGVIIAWNSGASALYGWSAAEAVGRRVTDLVAPHDHGELAEHRRRALAGERLTGLRVERRHKDGSLRSLAVDLYPVPVVGTPGHRSPAPATNPDLEELRRHLDRLGVGFFQAGRDGVITSAVGDALASQGLRAADAVGLNLLDFATDPVSREILAELLAGEPFTGPVAIAGELWEISCAPRNGDDDPVGVSGIVRRIDHSWEGVSTAALNESRFRALARHSSDLVCVIDDQACLRYVSPSVEKLLGWAPEEVAGRPVTDFARVEDLGGVGRFIQDVRAGARDRLVGGASHTFDVRLRHADGTWRDYECVTSDYEDDPAIGGFVVNGRDVTERRQAELRLRHAGLHDALTGLPNRTLLIQEVDSTVLRLDDDERVAVVVIGLDRFKLVNDSLGHDIGDGVLIELARRLRRQVRAADTVARLGGDSFVATTSGVLDGDDACNLASRLLAAVREPFEIAGRRVTLTAGAGVALSEPDTQGDELVRNADTAMYAAKRHGRGRIELFESSLLVNATRQLALEQSLSRATAGGELRVHFQPIMDLGSGSVVGVEALVRWEHPELGLVPPNDFIPLAEETGHILDIGRWVLHRSCETLMAWAGDGAPLRLAVNLSPRQLLEPDLADSVAEILDVTGFPVDRLTIEITESVLVDDGPYAVATLRRLRELGIRLSIDDFGTGYSSLVYLRRLNASVLKVDRSFVDGLGRDGEADAIVRTVIGLARSLGLDLVAEGVETEQQRGLLVELGCELAQGYLFSRPLPEDVFRAWHRDRTELAAPLA
jgi:diguanylate cyclase (GGDEF)-like protein/PAS domain S-box-containing protein